ncbi:TPM domain-containing protein [Klenkia brasiliensis]|uniref:TLP18.3, Psb32 and MOLO-1 founding protein of phosphatase n=1 Tax=Klenkia brasiliensis TaxID=333142 RepID=A0A1G7MKM4_9ACTN|nr:TPM domain-containing protein [Klenkia brasiliensis]SDF62257.1 TLP18.3, Psb32 and MOLO-1 founding protein of phosphatase [Klenkia brasiliensis]
MPRRRAVLPVPLRLAVALALVVGPVLLAGPAAAEAPSRLAGEVTDDAGVLSDADRSAVQQAVDGLRDDQGTQVFVAFVDSFDGTAADDWTEQAARLSDLGDDDVLLAVAVQDRSFSVSASYELVDDAQFADLTAAVEDRLRDQDWVGGVQALTDELRPSRTPQYVLAGVVGAAAVGGGGYLLVRRRRRAAAEADAVRRSGPFPDETTEQLRNRVGSGLLEVDEAVRASQLDLDYGRLQFGEQPVAEHAATLATARGELDRAFALQQELDLVETPDTPTEDRAVREKLAEQLELLHAADTRLDAAAADFAALRDLQNTAPQVLAGLAGRVTALRGRLPGEATRVASLQQRYAPASTAEVADLLPRAEQAVAAAEAALAAGQQAVAAGTSGQAVGPVHACEAAVTAAQTLLDGVGRHEQRLAAADTEVPRLLAEVDTELARLQTVPPAELAAAGGGDAAGVLSSAGAARTAAEQAFRTTPRDPLTALTRLTEADAVLDAALLSVDQARERTAKAVEQLPAALASARAAVGDVRGRLSLGGSSIGSSARTRLTAAEQQLTAAESTAGVDPVAALAAAVAARGAADAARQQLQADLDAARRVAQERDTGWGGGSGWGGSSGGWSSGGSWGGGRSSRSSGRSRSSSSRSSSRSSSGRRSGGSRSGGRRSRGGRF